LLRLVAIHAEMSILFRAVESVSFINLIAAALALFLTRDFDQDKRFIAQFACPGLSFETLEKWIVEVLDGSRALTLRFFGLSACMLFVDIRIIFAKSVRGVLPHFTFFPQVF
jgi:hypothetical protein